MGNETIMMTWNQLRNNLLSVPVEQQEDAWEQLKEHESYMEQKGYKITTEEVTSPTGETLWKR